MGPATHEFYSQLIAQAYIRVVCGQHRTVCVNPINVTSCPLDRNGERYASGWSKNNTSELFGSCGALISKTLLPYFTRPQSGYVVNVNAIMVKITTTLDAA